MINFTFLKHQLFHLYSNFPSLFFCNFHISLCSIHSGFQAIFFLILISLLVKKFINLLLISFSLLNGIFSILNYSSLLDLNLWCLFLEKLFPLLGVRVKLLESFFFKKEHFFFSWKVRFLLNKLSIILFNFQRLSL